MKSHEIISAIRSIRVILLFCIVLTIGFAKADLGVWVKKGDWLEYGVSYHGLPELAANFFGYEIIEVDGTKLTITGTTNFSNGTIETENYVVDIFGNSFRDFDGFIIPAPLGDGDSFYSGEESRGDLIVESIENRVYSGVERSVAVVNLSREEGSSVYVYDISLGVLVEYQRIESDYSIEVKLENTNLWSPRILGIEPACFYFLIVLIVLFVGLALFFALRKKRRF